MLRVAERESEIANSGAFEKAAYPHEGASPSWGFLRSRFLSGCWLAQSVERVTLDLGVMSSGPMLGIELTLKKKVSETFMRWIFNLRIKVEVTS